MGLNNKFHLYFNNNKLENGLWKRYKGGGGEKELKEDNDDKQKDLIFMKKRFEKSLNKLQKDFSKRYDSYKIKKREELNIIPTIYLKVTTIKKNLKKQKEFFEGLGMIFIHNNSLLSEFIVKMNLSDYFIFIDNIKKFINNSIETQLSSFEKKLTLFDDYSLITENDRLSNYFDYKNNNGKIKIHLYSNSNIDNFLKSLLLLNDKIKPEIIKNNIVEFKSSKLTYNDINMLSNYYDDIKKISASNMNLKVDSNGNISESIIKFNINDTKLSETICIVDSGIEKSVLNDFIDDDMSINFSIIGKNPLEDLKQNIGHGTNVASIVIFGNQIHNNKENLTPICKVCSLQVIGNGKVTSVSFRDIVDNIKRIHLNSGMKIKIFNLSFSTDVLKNNEISEFSFALDTIMHEYDILCIIATGNSQDNELYDYPIGWLTKDSNFNSPAESINGITVGSIGCRFNGDKYVSYYSRRNNIEYPRNFPNKLKKYNKKKPDILSFGGHKGNDLRTLGPLKRIVELHGTSFSTPYVTHLSSILRNVYGDITMNSIKGLILNNCESLIDEIDINIYQNFGVDISRIYGNGIISNDKVDSGKFVFSSDNCVTFLIESYIDFSDYSFNNYPYLTTKVKMPQFNNEKENVLIKATLCYNPLVNLTDDISEYNTCFMGFKLHCGDSDFKLKEIEGKIKSELTNLEGESWSSLPYKNYFWNNTQSKVFYLRKNKYNKLVENDLSITIRSLLKEDEFVIDWYKENKQNFSLIITIEEFGGEGNLYDFIKSENELFDIVENTSKTKTSSNLKLK